jgi:hypothetical protein
LVYLTPLVEIVSHRERKEVRWTPVEMPLAFEDAPFLVANSDARATSALGRAVADVNRDTWASRFASRFRSRQKPLAPDAARELIEIWDEVSLRPRARTYDEALPRRLGNPDRERRLTYDQLRKEAGADIVRERGLCRREPKTFKEAGAPRAVKRSC